MLLPSPTTGKSGRKRIHERRSMRVIAHLARAPDAKTQKILCPSKLCSIDCASAAYHCTAHASRGRIVRYNRPSMHPKALKSRILAAYVNVTPKPSAHSAWDAGGGFEAVRSEDVARWLIDHAPEHWAGWCHKYDMRFDPERDQFIDLNEWGNALAILCNDRRARDLTERLGSMIDPDPSTWNHLPPWRLG